MLYSLGLKDPWRRREKLSQVELSSNIGCQPLGVVVKFVGTSSTRAIDIGVDGKIPL